MRTDDPCRKKATTARIRIDTPHPEKLRFCDLSRERERSTRSVG